MKVEQHTYLSPEAVALRERDGTPPWGVHVCEVDSLRRLETEENQNPAFYAAWHDAKRLRDEIEAT